MQGILKKNQFFLTILILITIFKIFEILHCLFSYLKWFQNCSSFLIDCKISIGKHCIKILCYCWSLPKLFTTFATCICALHVHVHPKHTTIQKYRGFLLIQGENMLYEKFKTPFSKVLILAKN